MDVTNVSARRGRENEKADTSLRGKSLRRALQAEVPRTLTPYEWEQWYAQHGVPAGHRKPKERARRPWWRFWQASN